MKVNYNQAVKYKTIRLDQTWLKTIYFCLKNCRHSDSYQIYEVCSKSIANFVFFQKCFIYFMNIYFVPFKVIPTTHTLVSRCFPILEALQKIIFYDLVQLLLRCRLYLLNGSVASSFHGPLGNKKVTGGQIWGIRWVRHYQCVVFDQKFDAVFGQN